MFMAELIVLGILVGVPTAYMTRLLWLDTVDKGFEGIFVHQRKFVQIPVDDGEVHVQRLAWTDYLRQLFFNVYEAGKVNWVLKDNRQGLVRCTFCLSFWVSIVPALVIMLHLSAPFYLYPVAHFTIASVSAYLSNRM